MCTYYTGYYENTQSFISPILLFIHVIYSRVPGQCSRAIAVLSWFGIYFFYMPSYMLVCIVF